MKTNVITNALTVQLDTDGSLEIIGVFPGKVVLKAQADCLRAVPLSRIKFAKNMIVANSPTVEDRPVLIFEYSLWSELRNPRKLLKSVRNKLMGAVRTTQTEDDSSDELEDLSYFYDPQR
jgi:hypothetical protein